MVAPAKGFSASVTFRPVADTSLFEATPENNLGDVDLASGTTARGEKSRALIRFDLTGQVPANATISSAQLTLRVTKAPTGAIPSTFGLHRVLQDWGEGVKGGLTGATATAEEATWILRFFPDAPWSAPGAAAPDDFVAKASATRLIEGVANYSFASTVDLAADVQNWLAHPKANFGWILISQSEAVPKTARRFGSLEGADIAPSLVIEYSESVPNTATSITAEPEDQTVLVGGSATFRVKAAGTLPLSYQWKHKNEDIRGANTDTLTLSNVQTSQEGGYSVTVTGSGGTTTSRSAVLSVTTPGTGKRWTIMIYGHGDHNLSPSLVADMQEMEAAGSGADFNIVLQADFDAHNEKNVSGGLPSALGSGVSRFLVQQDSDRNAITSVPVERLPESMNLDDPAVLTQFVTWAAQKYPADRYGLVLWNHGGQWEGGFGGDSQDGTLEEKGSLSTAQIRSAVSAAMQTIGIKKMEFVAFDTCLMGGAEVLADFVPLTDTFLACAELDYGDGWEYGAALGFLKANPTVAAIDFGRAEVRAWEAHHMMPGNEADLQLASHGLYDLTKYAAFEEQFNAFGSLLSQAVTTRKTVLPRLRLETTQYSLEGVEQIGQPTDYIDLGELDDRLVVDPSTDATLKAAATRLIASIDALVVAKVLGAKKQLTHGLSVYYPVKGSKDNAKYLELGIASKPGYAWSQLLALVATDKAGDNEAPEVVSGPSTSLEPSVQIVSGADAYSMAASIVDNSFTGKADEYVYFGEVLNVSVKGVGDYKVPWNGSLPMISSSVGAGRIILGGFFEDVGSDILVSFAEYVPPGSTDSRFVLLMTRIRDGKATLIASLDGDEEDEGQAPKGIDLEPGGSLTPLYYMERRVGADPALWEGGGVSAKASIVIPPTGLAGIGVEFAQVPDGTYTMEVQVVDMFQNESKVVRYPVVIGQGGSAPSLSVQAAPAGKIVISWPAFATDFVLESNATATSAGWTPVPVANITTEGVNKTFVDSNTSSTRFYRLKKN